MTAEPSTSFVAAVGEVELVGGWAEVALDQRFRMLPKWCDYHVFVTSYCAGAVFVQNRTRSGFEIHVLPVAPVRHRSGARCGYLVVAQQRDARSPMRPEEPLGERLSVDRTGTDQENPST